MCICVVSRWRGRKFWKARKEISSTEIDLIFLGSGLYIKKKIILCEIKEIIYLINIT